MMENRSAIDQEVLLVVSCRESELNSQPSRAKSKDPTRERPRRPMTHRHYRHYERQRQKLKEIVTHNENLRRASCGRTLSFRQLARVPLHHSKPRGKDADRHHCEKQYTDLVQRKHEQSSLKTKQLDDSSALQSLPKCLKRQVSAPGLLTGDQLLPLITQTSPHEEENAPPFSDSVPIGFEVSRQIKSVQPYTQKKDTQNEELDCNRSSQRYTPLSSHRSKGPSLLPSLSPSPRTEAQHQLTLGAAVPIKPVLVNCNEGRALNVPRIHVSEHVLGANVHESLPHSTRSHDDGYESLPNRTRSLDDGYESLPNRTRSQSDGCAHLSSGAPDEPCLGTSASAPLLVSDCRLAYPDILEPMLKTLIPSDPVFSLQRTPTASMHGVFLPTLVLTPSTTELTGWASSPSSSVVESAPFN